MSTPAWAPIVPVWRSVGQITGPPGPKGVEREVATFTMSATLIPKIGTTRYPVKGGTFRIVTVAATVGGAPQGGPVTVDVKVNGTSIYTAGAGPSVAAGSLSATVGPHTVTDLTDGHSITVDVVSVGSTATGSDLVVAVRLERTA